MSETELSGANQPARRRSLRLRCDFPIRIEWGAEVLDGRVQEISAEGMFVELDAPLWIGARFSAQLVSPKAVRLDCVVCRVQPRRGMALKYQVPDEFDRAAVALLLKRLARS